MDRVDLLYLSDYRYLNILRLGFILKQPITTILKLPINLGTLYKF